jgi:hypothetical protein
MLENDEHSLGRPLYEKLGFHVQFELARFHGEPTAEPPGPADDPAEPCEPDQAEELIELDRSATRTDRGALLHHLVEEPVNGVGVHRENGMLTGYRITRPGTKARQIGPCIANTAEAGQALLAGALRRHGGEPVFGDAPLDNAPAVRTLEAAGLTRGRSFLRMCRGEDLREDTHRLWASSGPEKG